MTNLNSGTEIWTGSVSRQAAASTAGFWGGDMYDQVSGLTFRAYGLIGDNGVARFALLSPASMPPTQYIGQAFGAFPVSGQLIHGNLSGVMYPDNSFSNGTRFANLTMDGNLVPRSTFTGTWSGGGDWGTFNFSYNADDFEETPSLAKLAGTFSGRVIHDASLDPVGYLLTVTISPAGVLNGGDSRGCVYNGTVSLASAMHNYYALQVGATNCPQQAGTYTGFAGVSDAGGVEDKVFFWLANNGNSILTAIIPRQ